MTDAGPAASGQSGNQSQPGDEGSGSGSQPGGEGSGKTFTQEQVQALVAGEVRKERAKFGDYDELKTRLAQLEDKDKTDLERAQAAAKDSDAKAAAALARADRLAVRSALTSAAARAGAVDPELVVALLADELSVDDRGDVVGDVDKAVMGLLEAKPYLKNGSTATRGSVDGGAHGRPPASKPTSQMDNLLRTTE